MTTHLLSRIYRIFVDSGPASDMAISEDKVTHRGAIGRAVRVPALNDRSVCCLVRWFFP